MKDNLSMRVRKSYAEHFSLEMGKPDNVCIVKGCHKLVKARSICACHSQRLWRKVHPLTAQYARLKAEAKKKKREFTLTPDDWCELCNLTRYHERTVSAGVDRLRSLTIDRVDHRKGYVSGNVRVITYSLNSAKGAQEMQCRLKSGKHIELRKAEIESPLYDEQNPF